MAINTNSILQSSLKYGLYLGGSLIALSIIVYITGINVFSVGMAIGSFIINIGLFVLFFLFSSKNYRDNINNGNLSFLEGFIACIATGVIASILNGLYSFVFYSYIDPGYMTEMLNKFMETLATQNLTEAQLDEVYKRMQEATNKSPLMLSIDAVKGLAIISIILGLIIAAITKKQTSASVFEDDKSAEN